MFCRRVQRGSHVSPPWIGQRHQRRELGDAQDGLFDLTGAHAQEDRVAQARVYAVERAAADGGEAVMQRARVVAGRFQQDIGDARASGLAGCVGQRGQVRRTHHERYAEPRGQAAYASGFAPAGGTSKGRCSLILSATAAAPGSVAARMATGNPRSAAAAAAATAVSGAPGVSTTAMPST